MPNRIKYIRAPGLSKTPIGEEPGAAFEIPVTQSGNTYTTTASASDILANADNLVLAVHSIKIRCNIHSATTFYFDYLSEVIYDTMIEAGRYIVTIINNNVTITHEIAAATDTDSLPTVTTQNNGDFLRVVNGMWAAQTVPNAEEASF